jgi:hypothetical protein
MIALSLVFFLATASTPALGFINPYVDLKPGDWAEYSVDYPFMIPPHSTIRIEITGVDRSVVTFNDTWIISNEIVLKRPNVTLDVTKPFLSYDTAFTLIPYDLKAGEPTCPGSDLLINLTQTMLFAGANRSCNICYVNRNYGSHTLFGYYIWDQVTGLFLDYNLTNKFSNVSTTETDEIISTNIWPEPSGTTVVMAIGIPIAAIIAILVLAETRQKSHGTQSPRS